MTPGQVAYEAARDERLSRRPSDVVIGWGELNEGTRSMWEAAAQAVRRPLLQSIATGEQLDAERRGQPLRHPAEVFHKRGVRCELGDDCALFDDEKG